ncbi:MAG: hypothetical protein H7335_21675 [Massilia sp.]|nr:hypothetical protein [Massilia sp.]
MEKPWVDSNDKPCLFVIDCSCFFHSIVAFYEGMLVVSWRFPLFLTIRFGRFAGNARSLILKKGRDTTLVVIVNTGNFLWISQQN